MIASIVDTGDLLHVIWVSLAAGIGVTAAFGFAILGGTRAVELGRESRPGEAALFGIVGVAGGAVVVAAVIGGIVALAH